MMKKNKAQNPFPTCPDENPETKSSTTIVTTCFVLLLFATAFSLALLSFSANPQNERHDNLLPTHNSEHKSIHRCVADSASKKAFFKSTFNLGELTQKAKNDYCIDFYCDKTRIATIYVVGYRGDKSDEAKQACFLLGKTYCNGVSKDVYLNLYYIDEDGKCMHWNAADGELAVCKLFNTTAEQFASSFSLLQNPSKDAWKHCTPLLIEKDCSPIADNANDTEDIHEFWGVWVGASKDRAIADSIAGNAQNEGFKESQVIITSDWENLNTETWYAVTVGCFDSEEEAEAALEKARCLNQDAYIKHSGSHK